MSDQAAAPAAEAKPEKPARDKQNGITRPLAGTITGNIWGIADKLSADKGAPATRAEVVTEALKTPNSNQATVNTQYARWMTFYGAGAAIKEAKAAEKAAKVQAKADAKAAKAAEREQKKTEKEAAKAAKQAEKDAKAKADAEAAAAKAAQPAEPAAAPAKKGAKGKATA